MLGDVLKKVASHPARTSFLILDLHPLPADPRLGLLDADIGAGVREEVELYPATNWLVLMSASAGEVPATSEAIGRSIFSLYLEEGLRGWADVAEPGASPDGRVTAKELASYVRERVGRWVRRNRGRSQTPTLLHAETEDFPLVVLRRAAGGRTSRAGGFEEPARVSRMAQEGLGPARPVAPRRGRPRGARSRRRAGVCPARRRARLARRGRAGACADDPGRRLGAPARAARADPGDSRSSAGFAGAGDRRRSRPTIRSLVALRLAREARRHSGSDRGLRRRLDRRVLCGSIKTLTDLDLASAVVQVAAEVESPKRSEIAFLDALLRTRQPRPLYVETLTLDRLLARPRGRMGTGHGSPRASRRAPGRARLGQTRELCPGPSGPGRRQPHPVRRRDPSATARIRLSRGGSPAPPPGRPGLRRGSGR